MVKALVVLYKIGNFCIASSNEKHIEGKWYNRLYKYLYLAYTLYSIGFTIWLSYFFTNASKCPYDNDADCFNIYIVGLRF